jgi:hypothetical protein
VSLRRVKERTSHQRHQIGSARNRQSSSEARHHGDHRARKTKGSQCSVYGAAGAPTARSNNVTKSGVSLGSNFAFSEQGVAIPDGADKVIAKKSLYSHLGPRLSEHTDLEIYDPLS